MFAKNDVVAISRRANEAKKDGRKKVYDGTLGSILDDKGELVTLPSVYQAFTHADLDFGYSPVEGFEKFRERATNWILKSHVKNAKENHSILSFATLGGTGALAMGFKFARQYNFEVLIPDLSRPCYPQLCNGAICYYRKYRLYDENGSFGLDSISAIIAQDKEKFRGFLLVINDPCNNPSGHTMTEEEIDKLDKYARNTNLVGGTKLGILWDATYIDYAENEPAWLSKVVDSNEIFGNFIAFSGSKTFGVYGLRVGMLLGLFPKKQEAFVKDLIDLFERTALENYVSPDGLGMTVLSNLMTPKNSAIIRSELKPWADKLRERGAEMVKELDAAGVDHLPYQEGFYLTVRTQNDPALISSHLEKENIFLYPMQPEYLRLSIAALTPGNAKRIAKAIADLDAKEGLKPLSD